MDLKIKVKVGEINNLSDARYCAGMGVEMIGFSLDETNFKYLNPSKISEISNWLTGVKIVGEFESLPIEKILEMTKVLPLDLIQMSMGMDPELLKEIPIPIILQAQANDLELLALEMSRYKDIATYFLLEGEADLVAQESLLKELCQNYKILLGYGIRKNSVDYILQTIRPYGIALKGGIEIRPGLKDFEELSDILELLEPDEHNF